MKEFVRTISHRNKKLHDHEGCDVDMEYLLDLWHVQRGRCAYTNEEMHASDRVGRGRHPSAVSVDRIDSDLPYARGNVVLCTWWANMAKQTLTVAEFRQRCRNVATVANVVPVILEYVSRPETWKP